MDSGQDIGTGSWGPPVETGANPLVAGLGAVERRVSQEGSQSSMLFTYGRRSVSTSCSSIGANQCIPARSAPLPAHPVLILVLCATLNSGSNCPPIFHAHLKEMDGYKILNPGSHKDLIFPPKDSHGSRKRLQNTE